MGTQFLIPDTSHGWSGFFRDAVSLGTPFQRLWDEGSRDARLHAAFARRAVKKVLLTHKPIRTLKTQLTAQGPHLSANASGLAAPQTHTTHTLTHMTDPRNKH